MIKFLYGNIVIDEKNNEYVFIEYLDDNKIAQLYNGEIDSFVCFLTENLTKIGEGDPGLFYDTPGFQAIALMETIKLKNGKRGLVVAINPIMRPINKECIYFIKTDNGTYEEYKHSDIF